MQSPPTKFYRYPMSNAGDENFQH